MQLIVSQYFEKIVAGPDENINLAEAVLHIAQNEYPQLDIADKLLVLDQIAVELGERIGAEDAPEKVIGIIKDYLFGEKGFKGNLVNFNDPKNSFLNDVLERKLGIPISLSIIYIELGKRLGKVIEGVSFPGHFLVKYCALDKQFIIDPFSSGILLEESELLDRLKLFATDKPGVLELNNYLGAATNHEILQRVLRNLKYIYMDTEVYDKALSISNLLLILEPKSLDGIRDRACIFEKLDCFRAASEDFQRYLALNPMASDHEKIEAHIGKLQISIARLH
jgi:regulator of sirC expression with transglutaminase-like and TPR domain